MTVTPDDDFAAAEFALGTLDPGERAVMAARRLRDPDLDEAIRDWEARLAPLAEAARPRRRRRTRRRSRSGAASPAGERRRSPRPSSPPCWPSASSPARRRGR